MKADEFYAQIKILRENFEKVDRDSLDFLIRDALIGTIIKPREAMMAHYENEIEKLLDQYEFPASDYLLNGISIYESVYNNQTDPSLVIFGSLDGGLLCYDQNHRVSWHDDVQLMEMSLVATTPELFLDVLYSIAHHNLFREMDKEDLCKKLIYESGDNQTKVFYEYLLGLIE